MHIIQVYRKMLFFLIISPVWSALPDAVSWTADDVKSNVT